MTQSFIDTHQGRLLKQKNAYLEQFSSSCAQLDEATEYVLAKSGKQLRALLMFAAGEISQAPIALIERAAWAIELIHSYSLVHDDLPAMDDADLRRGQATCHKKYSEATAILVGDALQTNAFSWLASTPVQSIEETKKLLKAIKRLGDAAGSLGMVAGQSLDLTIEPNTIERLSETHRLKTGALFEAAVLIGAEFGDVSPSTLELLQRFIEKLGLAYQIQDDILDETVSTDTLGKPAFADQENNKITFVTLLGLDQAKSLLEDTFQEAQSALGKIGEPARTLMDLCEQISHRQH